MLRPWLAKGTEHRQSSARSKFGASYVSGTRAGASRLNSQESMGSNPYAGDSTGAKAACLNSQESMVSNSDAGEKAARRNSNANSNVDSMVSWEDDKGDELAANMRKE